MSTETTKKKTPPQIATLDIALKLAEQWVNNMNGSAEDKHEAEPEGRPHRLGLGAKVSRQAKAGSYNDPAERRLNAKLEAGKRRAAKNEESAPSGRDQSNEDDDEDDDLESRSSAFTKKRVVPPTSMLPAKKKQK